MSIKTIEDCLETLVGLVDETTGQHVIDNNDYSILTSIGRQVFRGIALTDRQYEVVKSKIKNKYITLCSFITSINLFSFPILATSKINQGTKK